MDAEEKRKQLEKDILEIIAQKLQNGQMDLGRAQQIAKLLLEKLHPPLTLEQIYEIAPTLDDHFKELSQAILPLLSEHESEVDKLVAEHAERMIKSGKFDEAEKLLIKRIQKEDKNA